MGFRTGRIIRDHRITDHRPRVRRHLTDHLGQPTPFCTDKETEAKRGSVT